MATFNTIQTRVSNLVGDHSMITSTKIQQIIAAEHDTILNDNSWADRKAEGTIATTATYSTGTVTTSGTTVTGTGTTFTASMAGSWIRFSSETQFFKISAYVGATELTIERAIPAGDVTDSTFEIFQHVYALPSDCERVISMVYQAPIHDATRNELDDLDPYRTARASVPTRRSYRELSSTGARQIELWPVPNAAILIRFQYLKTNAAPTAGEDWSADTTSPLYRADVLVWKAGETCAFYLFSKTGDQSWFELAKNYHSNYIEALQGAKLDDLGKNSPARKIRDVMYTTWPYYGAGTDFSLDHDTGTY